MHDPLRMIFINLFSFTLLACGLIFYKYIYPKKSINPIVLVILLSILPIINNFRPGDYESGDFNIHIYRSIDFFESLKEGIIRPSWPLSLNATYGHPVYFFAAPLPYYINSFFHVLGFSFITSMKLLLALSFIASGIAMYLWTNKELGKSAGLIASVFYLYAPFHLVDLHFRVSPGDTLGYAFFPLILLSCYQLIKKPTINWFLIGAISQSLAILAHPITLVISIFTLFYCFYRFSWERKIKNMVTCFFSLFTGLLLSSFYWIPLVIERQYTFDAHKTFIVSFTELSAYIYSPWRYGLLFQGPMGELSFVIGYTQWIIIIIAGIYLIKSKFNQKDKGIILFYIISFASTFLLTQSISKPIWTIFPLLNGIQFSYRLMFLLVILSSIIAAIILQKIKKKWIIYAICIITILSTILNWGHRRLIPHINDTALRNNLPYATSQAEGASPIATIWRDLENPWMKKIPTRHLEILSGKGKITEIKRKSTYHEYIIYAENYLTLKENTLYYPGWTLFIDNQMRPINFQNKNYPGIITFNAKPGLHKINLVFKDTLVRKISGLLSLFTLFIIASFLTLAIAKKVKFK